MFKPGSDSELLLKEVWWDRAPDFERGETESDVSWGYLEVYRTPAGIRHFFNETTPPRIEIENRKSCRQGK